MATPGDVTPTHTPRATATRTPSPAPPPEIQFWADDDHLTRGECTTLRWQTEHVQGVYYQDQGVAGDGSRQECPQQTTDYVLRVQTGQGEETHIVTV
ncbi:MAG: hypothetical protein ACUVX9_11545 [Anaerolineae bacterium]